MLRELVARISKSIAERRAAARRTYNFPVKVCFAPVEKDPVTSHSSCDDAFVSGEMADVSVTGIGFVVSAIRIKEKYLVGQDRLLNVEVDLGGGKLRMQVRGVRYERVGIHLSTERYLIGAEIVSVDEQDQEAYADLVRQGSTRPRHSITPVEAAAK